MTPDERNLLLDLANNIAQAPAPQRDPEAEEIIRTKIGKRPDALYLMTQTVLIQNLALQRAQQQIRDLQSRLPQGSTGSGSFLGQQGGASYPSGGGQQQYSAPPPQYAAPGPVSGGGGGGGGFLRGAAQTAAGVAAGTLAADAIGSMFSHGGGMFGGGSGFFGGGEAPREEIVNNYYDSPRDDLQTADRGDQFVDPGNVNDASTFDDNSQFDDSAVDDGGGFDNSGDDSLFS